MKNKLKIVLIIVGVGILASFGLGWYSLNSQIRELNNQLTSLQKRVEVIEEWLFPPSNNVSEVIDGDTIVLKNGEKIRLLGVNTPERGEEWFEEAKTKLEELVENKRIKLEKDEEDKDQYGRLLRYIYIDDTFVNLELVKECYATPYIVPPNIRYEDQLRNAWEECLNKGIRLAEPSIVCDDCVEIASFHWNAGGNDCENLNDEYVTFKNICNSSCNMTSWTVKDESSRTPYIFPDFVLNSESKVILYTGCGDNTGNKLYWCSSGYTCNAIWNNQGDTLILRDKDSKLVIYHHYSGFSE